MGAYPRINHYSFTFRYSIPCWPVLQESRERYVIMSLLTLPTSTQDNPAVAQRHPMERLVHHSVSLLQLILLVTENLWTIFFLLFFDVLVAELGDDKYALSFKIVFHMFMALTLIPSWFFAATGAPGVIRWQPTGDHLARFIPPSIANATVTKRM